MSWEVYSHFHKATGVILACVIGVALSLILMGFALSKLKTARFSSG